jgi:trimeric autotransporter adhesin
MKILPSHFLYGMSRISVRGISSPVTYLINQQKSNLMKKRLLQFVIVLMSLAIGQLNAQLTGIKTIPGNYASISAAVTDLNTQGVGAGGVTFNVAAGYSESISSQITITATGTAGNPIIFQKSGAGTNPLVTRTDVGSNATSAIGALGDGIFRLDGTDYITFDGIDVTATDAGIEYGYYTHKPSATDGCQFVTIKNCTISMTKGTSGYVCGINISNGSTSASSATGVTVTAVSGENTNIVITGNTITNVHAGIYCRGSSATGFYDSDFTIGQSGAGNTIQNFGGGNVSTTYGVYFIYVNNPSVSFNTINNAGGGGLPHGSTLYGVFYSTVLGNVVGSNNTFNLSNNSASSATYYSYNSNLVTSETYNNNSFAMGTMSSTGTVYIVYSSSGTLNKSLSNNVTSGTLARTGASGSLYCYYNLGSPASGTETINNNNFSNITLSGSSGFYGIYTNTAVGHNKIFSNNTISNITGGTGTTYCLYSLSGTTNQVFNNTVSNITAGGSVYCLYFTGTNPVVYNNTVKTITTSGTAIYGVYDAGTGITNCYKNKVYDLTINNASPSLYGFYITTGTDNMVYNNYVGNLYAPTANSTTAIAGMYVSGGTKISLFFNTIYVNAVSSGTNFGTMGVYASTTPTFIMKSNIIVNTSTPMGTGFTSAYRRSSTTLTTYDASSNNNLFYAGTPSASNVIYYDGTTAQSTLAAYKTLVSPRDALSVTENPSFISTTGSNANFLHISNATPTQIESGGIPVTGIIDDFDGDVRNVTTPDIGADEGTFILLDINPPLISFTPLQNSCSTGTRTFVATITDPSGVPTTGIGLPVLYWSINSSTGPWTSSTGSFIGSNQYQFSLGTGSVVGNTIYYYIVAQDMASTPNVGCNPSAGAAGFSINPPAASTQPTTPYSYVNIPTMSGTFTVGAMGAYSTIGAAVTAYNNSCVSGPVVFNLIDSSYPSETFPITINSNPGSSPVNTLTIKPSVVTNISGSGTSIFKLNGADYVIIDGSIGNAVNSVCPMVTATRDLTISNSNASSSTCVIWNGSASSTDGATNNVFKNINVLGATSTTTLAGIFSGSGVTAGAVAEAPNSYCTFENNSCGRSQYGIAIAGAATFNQGDNVRLNSLGSSISGDMLGFIGMFFSNSNNLTVDKNTVFDIVTASTNPMGISIAANVLNSVFNRNTINNIMYTGTGGYGGKGININTGVAASNLTISNNMISDMKGDGYSTFTTDAIVGIRLLGTSGGIKIYHNTVNLGSGTFAGYSSSGNSAALYIASTNTNLDIRNNIFGSNLYNSNYASAKTYAIYSAAPNTAFAIINNNDYFVSGSQGVLGAVNSIDVTSLPALQAATGQDANSKNATPVFNSSTDPHLVMSDPANLPLFCAGAALPLITTDIDCNARSAMTPTIGADENPNLLTVSLTLFENSPATPNGTVCAGESVNINSTVTNGSGSQTYLWSPGGATTANLTGVVPTAPSTTYTVIVTDGSCQNSASITVNVVSPYIAPTFTQIGPLCRNSTPPALPSTSNNGITGTWSPSIISTANFGSTTYYFTPNAGQCAKDTSMIITINGPSLSETHILPTSCLGADGSIDLTVVGTGPFTYSWIGPNGYTANSQDLTNLNGGYYYVTVTDGNTCTNTLNVNLDLNPSCLACPLLGTLTAVPPVICQGQQSALTVNGLVGLGVTYGIKFVYSTTVLNTSQLYSGSGSPIATITNANLGGGGTFATTTYTFNTFGNLYLYAILYPTPGDQTCRPVSVSSITVNSLPPVPIVQNITTCFGGSTLIVPTTTGGGTSTVSNIFTWDFEAGITGGGVSQYPGIASNGPAQTVGAGITMGPQGAGSGCTAAVTTTGYNVAPGNTLADAKTSGDYIEFCIGSAVAPSVFSGVTAVNWANRASGTGPINYVLVAANDINTTLLSGTVTPGGSTCELEGGSISLNTSTCYRIYYYSATNVSGTLRIDNLTITASYSSPYSGGTFNFYSNATLTNKVAGPVASYDPMTTPANSPQTVWVTQFNTVTGCESAAVPVVITVYSLPTAEAGNNQFYCGLPASITITATSNYNGQWTQTGGAGTIVSPTSKTTTYTTNAADIGKTVVFTWTTITPQGACANATDQMGLTTVRPTADAQFAYALDEYCPGSANPVVTHTTGVDGIYTYSVVSAGPTLTLNNITGEINMATSNWGTYNVTNHVDGRGNLIITGVVDGPLSGGLPKAIELYAIKDIYNLGRYGIESANNGGGSAGVPEFVFPQGQFVAAGTRIWISADAPQFVSFFGFSPTFINNVAQINGDDAIVLYNDGQVIDVFGQVSYPANSPLAWIYEDGWAYRKNSTTNDGTVFNLSNWNFSGRDALDNAVTNASANLPWPINSFVTTLPGGCSNNSHVETIIVGDLIPPTLECPDNIGVVLDPGDCSAYVHWNDPVASDNCVTNFVIEQIGGPAEGSEFTMNGSPYIIEYQTTANNQTVTCEFTITIYGYPEPIVGQLACNDTVQVSLDSICEIKLNADMFLEGGPYQCYNDFQLYINSPLFNGVDITNLPITLIPGTYTITVGDAANTLNTCNTVMVLKDKYPPQIICNCPVGGGSQNGGYSENCILDGCYDSNYNYNLPSPTVIEYCDYNLKLISTEIIDGPTCGTQLLRKTWRATDIGGNTSECTQEYYFKGFDVANMTWPKNYDDLVVNNKMLECDATYPVDELGNPHPSFTGYPSGSGTCKLVEVFYDDVMYPLSCGTKILRNWIVVDDCKGTVYTHTQIIRITDRKAPTFCQPEIFKVNTKAYSCDANVNVPAINCLEDNCCNDLKWWVGTSQNFQISGDLNGNGYVDNNEQWKLMNVPVGVYELRYYAKDCCDNIETKGVLFEVYDGMPPIATCEQFKTVSLSVYGEAKISAVDFNSGSFDNCKPVYFKALRVNNNFEYDGGCKDLNGDDNPTTPNTIDVWYDDEVYFCCNDLTNTVMVGMRVYEVNPGSGPVDPRRYAFGGDLYGHYNDCWSIVTVECKVPPALTCPAIEVSCEESLDPNINPKLWPQVTYICNVDLTYTDVRDNNVCSGNVTRTWTAKSCDKTSQCKQTIKINPSTPFDPCTIVFPVDKQVHCTNQLPDGGVPTWDEYPCNVVTAEVIKEDTFNFVEGACKKILREWAVIDWCVYKPNVGAEANIDAVTSARKLNCNSLVRDGYYRYTQELRVVDFIPPTIHTEDQCIGFTEGCFATGVKLQAFASDSCNTNEEYWWKYVVIDMDSWDTIQYSYNYLPKPLTGVKGARSRDKLDKTATSTLELLNPIPGGIYKVVWTVGDGCGNANKEEQIFTVVDRKAPTPVLVNIATSTMVNCQLEVCAIMFDKGGCNGSCISSFDNCTPKEELYFTFTPVLPKLYIDPAKWENQYNKYGRYFYDPVTGLISTEDKYLHSEALAWDPIRKTSCKYFGIGRDGYGPDHTQILEVYVWDKYAANEECDNNNYDYGVIVLSINTEGDGCPEPASLVKGSINNCVYENGLQEVMVNLDNGVETKVSMTDSNGKFSSGLNDGSYNITAKKQISGIPGLTTLDLVIIQKHVLGLKTVKDYCKLASMDINGDGKITASDILSGRKLILGYSEAKLNYNFLSNSYISENINNPLFSLKDAYSIKLNVEKGHSYNSIDFSGVMTGDVNNSVGFMEGRNGNIVKLLVDELELINGESYEIPVYAKGIKEGDGIQFELSYNGFEINNISSDILDISKMNYKVDNNKLRFSWNGNNVIMSDENKPLFTISINCTEQAHLNNSIEISNINIKPEVYSDEEISDVILEFRNSVGSFALHQNIPNPFSDKAVIGFDLPVENTYTLSIFDLTGKIVKEIAGYGKSGYNSVNIARKDIGGNGVFYYRLKSGENTDTRKMILIQ